MKLLNKISRQIQILWLKHVIYPRTAVYFNPEYYLNNYSDVKESGSDPFLHYMLYGWKENRNPSEIFDTKYYLDNNPDVIKSGMNPLMHYLNKGLKQGRKINKHFSGHTQYLRKEYLRQKRSDLSRFLKSNEKFDFVEKNPEISIILVLFNKAELTFSCLKSIKKNANIPLEIIIVNNYPTDKTTSLLDKVHVAKIIHNSENLHFLAACNQALEYVSSPSVLFLNNDTEIQKDAFRSALSSLYENDAVGAVGAKLILPDGMLQEAGSIIWNDGSCLGYGRGSHPNLPEFNFKRIVDYCSGAFLLTRTDLIKKHDGFDERFSPAYYEETDYCLWLQENGYHVIYDPGVVINHFEFASSDKTKSIDSQVCNRQKFADKHAKQLAKHYPPKDLNICTARFAASQSNQIRILYIDDKVPMPFYGSGYPRAHSVIKILEEAGYQITIYPNIFTDSENIDSIYQYYSPYTEVILNHGHWKFGQFLEKRKDYYDIIWISRPHNMDYCEEELKRNSDNYKIIYDAEAIFAEREFIKQKILGKPLTNKFLADQVKSEIRLCRIADFVFSVTTDDAKKFRDDGVKSVEVLGHYLNIQPGENGFHERKDLLFVGNLDHLDSPNVDSVVWFVNDVFPLIQKSNENIILHIIGSSNAKPIREIENDRIQVHGKVDDIRKFYNRCRVFIAPTRFAAGIPYKIHEAASYGIPVVATTLLANQLSWKNRELINASEAIKESFSKAVIELYSDTILWNRIRKNAILEIKKCHCKSTFKQFIQNVVTNLTDHCEKNEKNWSGIDT